jgi:uncharacterized membrane-anchored protein
VKVEDNTNLIIALAASIGGGLIMAILVFFIFKKLKYDKTQKKYV